MCVCLCVCVCTLTLRLIPFTSVNFTLSRVCVCVCVSVSIEALNYDHFLIFNGSKIKLFRIFVAISGHHLLIRVIFPKASF